MYGNSFHNVQAKFMEKMSLTSKNVSFYFKYSITKLELQFVLEKTRSTFLSSSFWFQRRWIIRSWLWNNVLRGSRSWRCSGSLVSPNLESKRPWKPLGGSLGGPVALNKCWKESEVPRNWLEKVELWLGVQKLMSSCRGLQDQNQELFDPVVILSKPSTNPKIR